MQIEQRVAAHYTRGGLLDAILQALTSIGNDPSRLSIDDLATLDEFHIGGRQATIDLAAQLGVRPGMHVLDVGCGIGGPARYFAEAQGVRVAGIDLTEEFVEVARSLSQRTGLADRVEHWHGSALELPFPEGTFDAAYMIHVGMNIADKGALFCGIRRVIKSGGALAVYDLMRTGEGPIAYPVPWAATEDASFLATPAEYKEHLEAAGFAIVKERSRREFAIEFFEKMRAQMAQSGPQPLGLHLVMGPTAKEKIANTIAAVEGGVVAPVEIVARAQ